MPDNATHTDADRASLLLCEGPNRITRQFREALSAVAPGTREWDDIIRRSIDSQHEILQILGFLEIANSGDPRWLDDLVARSKSPVNATVLSSIYDAIMRLGGLTAADCAALCKASDASSRSAAMIVLYSLSPHDAEKILRDMLMSDPDDSLRREAAKRLAYMGSGDGLHELLKSLDAPEFYQRVQAACALSALGHPAGLAHVRELLKHRSQLPTPDLGALAFALQTMLHNCGVEHTPRNAQPAEVIASTFETATIWMESRHAADSDTPPPDKRPPQPE